MVPASPRVPYANTEMGAKGSKPEDGNGARVGQRIDSHPNPKKRSRSPRSESPSSGADKKKSMTVDPRGDDIAPCDDIHIPKAEHSPQSRPSSRSSSSSPLPPSPPRSADVDAPRTGTRFAPARLHPSLPARPTPGTSSSSSTSPPADAASTSRATPVVEPATDTGLPARQRQPSIATTQTESKSSTASQAGPPSRPTSLAMNRPVRLHAPLPTRSVAAAAAGPVPVPAPLPSPSITSPTMVPSPAFSRHSFGSVADVEAEAAAATPTSATSQRPWPHAPTCSFDLMQRSIDWWTTKVSQTKFQTPEQIASFSYDENRRLYHDDRSLKFFHYPPPGADLNRGYRQYVQRDESRNEHLDSLVYSLMHIAKDPQEIAKDPQQDVHRQRADVITWRGMATKLCTALYAEQDGSSFEMNVMSVNGTLYIEEWVSAEARAAKAEREANSRLHKFSYYGYAFESWCTSGRDRGPFFDYANDDPWDGNVNTNVQWCSIVKTKLGTTRLILGGEVDCVAPVVAEGQGPPGVGAANVVQRYEKVELKTNMELKRQEDEVRFEKKMLRFYTQSFLLGIERILVGFRDRQGKITGQHEFKTLEMHRLVRKKPHAWYPVPCLNAASQMLLFLRQRVTEAVEAAQAEESSSGGGGGGGGGGGAHADPPMFRIKFTPPFEKLRLVRLTPEEVSEVKGPDVSRAGFLPRDYYDFALSTPRLP